MYFSGPKGMRTLLWMSNVVMSQQELATFLDGVDVLARKPA